MYCLLYIIEDRYYYTNVYKVNMFLFVMTTRDTIQTDERKVNSIIGELITRDKYKFISVELLGEIIRDFVKEYIQ